MFATKMQQTVYYHPQQFPIISHSEKLRIRSHRLKRDKQVPSHPIAFRIIKRYDIRIIVVMQKLPVDTQYHIIRTEAVTKIAEPPTVGHGHSIKPPADAPFVDKRHLYRISLKFYHRSKNLFSKPQK